MGSIISAIQAGEWEKIVAIFNDSLADLKKFLKTNTVSIIFASIIFALIFFIWGSIIVPAILAATKMLATGGIMLALSGLAKSAGLGFVLFIFLTYLNYRRCFHTCVRYETKESGINDGEELKKIQETCKDSCWKTGTFFLKTGAEKYFLPASMAKISEPT